MDFNFSDDQLALREAVARWVDKSYPFEERQRRVNGDAASVSERQTYTDLAELGLTALAVDEAHGGMGLGAVEAMVVLHELGRGIVNAPLAQAFIAATVLQQYAPADVQQAWLPRIASGEALVVLAHQERAARYRLNVCEAKTVQTQAGYALTAIKNVVPCGDVADAFIVPALLNGHMQLFMVERAAAGVHTRGYATQDGSRAADVLLQDAPATLLAPEGELALIHAADVGIACVCAEGVGAMDKLLEMTVEYMQQRRQFGVPIASFQALRHRVADMKMQLELARSMAYYASLKLSAPAAERQQAMARAKVQLGQSMRYVGQQAVQLHGGIGVTDEYAGSHYFKKLTQLEMTWGDTLHHLGEVSQRMGAHAGVFA